MLESLIGKSDVYKNTYIIISWSEGHKEFLNEPSVTFTKKTDGKDPKKRERYWMRILKTVEPYDFDPIQDEPFRGCSQMGGRSKRPPSPLSLSLSHISYNDETWYGYTIPKEDRKNI